MGTRPPARIGIDFGTTNSAVAAMVEGRPVVIRNLRGEKLTPSVVHVGEGGNVLVGEQARRRAVTSADRTVTGVKRMLGTAAAVTAAGRRYRPEEIASWILSQLREDAAASLRQPITHAVVTAPAHYDDPRRQSLRDACRIAGIEAVRIINEPTAAALAYGLNRRGRGTVLVYDLGGGTFDVSVLEIGDGVFEVLGTGGNNNLGGDDFDERLASLLSERFRGRHGTDLGADPMARQKLREESERAKRALSEEEEVEVRLPFISAGPEGPVHYRDTVTREDFEALIADLVDETIRLSEKALEEAGHRRVDALVLVGGSTRIPLVARRIQELAGREAETGVNPEEAVAVGAAIQAGILAGEVTDIVLVDVTPLSLGLETAGDIFVPIIERNTPVPTAGRRIFTTVQDFQQAIEIHVRQGERRRASENISLGKFRMDGILPANRGVPKLEVSFEIDVNGIVSVGARDLATGAAQEVTVTESQRLSPDQVERMIAAARRKRDEDERFVSLAREREACRAAAEKARGRLRFLDGRAGAKLRENLVFSLREMETATSGIDVEVMREERRKLFYFLNAVSASPGAPT